MTVLTESPRRLDDCPDGVETTGPIPKSRNASLLKSFMHGRIVAYRPLYGWYASLYFARTARMLFLRACAINIMNIISSFAWISQFTTPGWYLRLARLNDASKDMQLLSAISF